MWWHAAACGCDFMAISPGYNNLPIKQLKYFKYSNRKSVVASVANLNNKNDNQT